VTLPSALSRSFVGKRETLERWATRPKSTPALALRCRKVLAAACGEANGAIAARLGCHATMVGE